MKSCIALCVVATVGCATSSSSATRELPVGLGSLGAHLDGCQPDAEDDVVRMRCSDGVVLAVRKRLASAAEPQYRAEAYGMAQTVGARLVWDQIVVATEGPSGLLDRARALEPGTDAVKGTLMGAVRGMRKDDVQEVWCSAADDAGTERCKSLVGAFLGTNAEASPEESAAAAQAAPKTTSMGPVTVFGRALSLPTSCKVKPVADGGDAECSDGVSLSWRRYTQMEEATQAVQATLDALGNQDEGQPYPCTIVGEQAQCEAHERAVAGVAYLDGKPIAVLCLGVNGAKDHSLCRALIQPR